MRGVLSQEMDAYLIKQPTLDYCDAFFKDFWTLVAQACEWPELISLTHVSKHARQAAQGALQKGTRAFGDMCWILGKYATTVMAHWEIHFPSTRMYRVGSDPFRSYRSMAHHLRRGLQNMTLREIELHYKCEKMQRFARIVGVLHLKGPLLKWRKVA